MEQASSIIIIPPLEVQQLAVPILFQYSLPDLIRGPAHISVMYPFVPYEQLETASRHVQRLCSNVAPFDVTLSGYGIFPLAIYMQLVNPEPVKVLFRQLYAQFPDHPPYGGSYGNDLHPHMTVAQFPTEEERLTAIPDLATLPAYPPVTFRVSRLHIMYGIDKTAIPWITHSVIRLGAGA